jgi:hypothetical protein
MPLILGIGIFPTRLAVVLLSCLIICFPHVVSGQNRTNANESLKCSITLDRNHIFSGERVNVQITIENASDSDLKFWAEFLFDLRTVESISRQMEIRGDRYYSRSGIATKKGQLALVPKDLNKMVRINRTTSRFVNEEVHLKKGETKQFRVDLTELLWADGISSSWPYEQFWKLVPKGKYRLSFTIARDGTDTVSNEVELELQ